MNKIKQKSIKITAILILSLIILSIILAIFTSLSLIGALRAVFGTGYVLFIPGFLLTLLLFPIKIEFSEIKSKIDIIERTALSFGLSIAIVPLVIFYLNLIGIKINTLNTFLSILGIIIVFSVFLYMRTRRRHNSYSH